VGLPIECTTLSDDDTFAWRRHQVAALRDLVNRRELPDQFDLTNVVEESRDVDRSAYRVVDSFAVNFLPARSCLGKPLT
jgi:hypothetical protein